MATSRSLGTLTIDLIAKIGGFVQGMSQAEREANRAQAKIAAEAKRRAKETEEAWSKAGVVIGSALATAVGAVLAGGAVFNKFLTETVQAQKEQAGLAAALKATGNAAGFSQGRLNEMAGAMESATGIAAGELNQAQKVLTGFTNVVGENYAKALQSAADYSAYTGQSMVASAELMGRALNIPSVGMASLSKQGFKFTEEQIKLARSLEETGRVAEAQKIVFDALEETYGGAAAASRDTLGGAMSALKNTINSLMTGDGGSVDGLKNAINDLAATVGSESVRSAFQSLVTWMAEAANVAAKAATKIVEAGELIKNSSFWGWLQVGAKDSDNLSGSIEETERKIASLQKSVTSMSRPLHRLWNADDIIIANGQIDTLQSKLQGLYALRDQRMKSALAGLPGEGASALMAPDLTPVAPGAIKLKDDRAAKRGGKTQAERDADAADRYIAALAAAADGRKQLTAYERLAYDLEVGKVKMTERQRALAEGQATAIDMAREAEKLRGDAILRNNALYEAQERVLSKSAEYQMLLSTYGMGDKEAAQLRERIGLMQKHQEELRRMENDQANALMGAKDSGETDRLKERYAERLEIVRGAQAEELRLYEDFTAAKMQKDGDWVAGMQSAAKTYLEQTQDVYAIAKDATTSMANTLEGALTSVFTRGEASFKSFVATILKGIMDIAARQAASGLAGFLTNLISGAISGGASSAGSYGSAYSQGGSFSFGRASGGNVMANSLYRVNENGPELLTVGGKDYLMTGGSSGYVTPNAANLGNSPRQSGNVTIVNQTTGRIGSVEERVVGEDRVLIIQEAVAAVRSELQDANSRTSRTMVASFNTSRRR